MKNSFKKAVACLLAVLMVAFSVPFTASAAVVNAEPDIDIVFGTLFDQGSGYVPGDNPYFGTHGTSTATVDISYAGPTNAPVTLDANGHLVLLADATQHIGEYFEDPDTFPAAESDYTLQNGDLFTVTVIAHNVSSVNMIMSQLTWNKEAITPAGLWYYKGETRAGKKSYKWGTLDELEAQKNGDGNYKESSWLIGGDKPVEELSAFNMYNGNINDMDGCDDDSFANSDYLYACCMSLNGSSGDNVAAIGGAYEEFVPNPYTGEYDGYFDNNNNMIMSTFIFKLLDNTKPLGFDVYDKENTGLHYENGKYAAAQASMLPPDLVTYSYNTYTGTWDSSCTDPNGVEHPGSRKMTFQGQRYEVGGSQQEDEYTVTFLDATGAEISSVTGPTGTAVTAPDLANYAKAADASGHYTTSWDATPVTEIGNADATYTVTYSAAIAHTYGAAENTVDATCTAGGSYDEVCSECGYVNHVETNALGHSLTAVPAVAATCTTNGNSAYWTCSTCGKFFSDAQGSTEIAADSWVIAAAHQDIQHVAAVAATATENGNIEYWYCAACDKYFSDAACTNEITQADTIIEAAGYAYVFKEIQFAEEDGNVTAKAILVAQEDETKTKEAAVDSCSITATNAATCTATGTATWTATYGNESATYEQTLAMVAHTPGAAAQEDVVAATCSAEGSYNEVIRCTVCNEILSSEAKVIEKAAHTPGAAAQEDVVAATCTEEGSYNEVIRCTVCNEIISSDAKVIGALGHDFGEWTETKAPTKKDAGEKRRECSRCDAFETEEIPALGYTVTIAKADLGTVTGTIESDGNEASATLQAGDSYTVTANPIDGAEFVGWQIGNKIITENATYSGVVYSDITLTPVYVETVSNTLTVVFYDLYGNVVDTFIGSSADWEAYELPEPPARPGYTNGRWDKAKEDITESTTVWAKYDKVETGSYTITTSATLELPDGVENGSIPYNTKATVRDDNATAWMIGDSIVAYGTEYTFYVGASVTITPVTNAVEQTPTVTIIGAELISGTKYNFLATMTAPAGTKITSRGFVYGKNLSEADLDIDKEGQNGSLSDSATVKVVRTASNASEQFSLAYSLSEKPGRRYATMKAFIVTSTGEVIYSDMFTFDYASSTQVDNI